MQSSEGMMKRRRNSSVTARDDEGSGSEQLEPSRKRKKYDPLEVCQQLYDLIRNYKKEDGGLLCDAFIRVPKRRQEPGYYEVVNNPIDLLKIQQKLKTDEYDDVDQLSADVELMCANAKSFYKRSSQEYRDACELWDLFYDARLEKTGEDERAGSSRRGSASGDDGSGSGSEHKGKIILKVGKLARRAAAAEARRQELEQQQHEDNSESSTSMTADDADNINAYEELFSAVMLATDTEERPLHTVFQLLPSRKRYPEYYEVIEHPIDLKTIATKIQNNTYSNLGDLERDLLQMTKNACTFNEPGSKIYRDAKLLRKTVVSKKIEIEHGRTTPGKSSERIRNKRLRGGQSLSAITAALQYEEEEDDPDNEEDEDDEEEEDEEEEEDDGVEQTGEEVEDSDSPQWQLYESVRSCTNSQGYLLSEPFLRLPSRRYYPDYYKEIKNPISLSQIGAKIQRGDYGNISEVAGDMNIMFENAKQYNMPDSRLYKDAVKLQKIMQSKVQELLDFDMGSSSEDETGRKKKAKVGGSCGSNLSSISHHTRTVAKSPEAILRKKLSTLYRSLIDYVHEDGRQPILMFMEKPSKKTYPDYYQVIAEPIDMLTIESNIKTERYSNEDELLDDFRLMFNNCRQYNEEGSVIYEDANTLEQVLMDRAKEIGAGSINSSDSAKKLKNYRIKKNNPSTLVHKLKTLYDAVKDYKDPKGRQLSLIFSKLPSKSEYPDYYEVIKKPIDLERILQRLKTNQYDSLDELLSDLVLMFDNACKYNEPDSQIYKDALTLQRLALQTKMQLNEDQDAIPDVRAAIQELLTSLFISVYNHQDEEGRCFSDAMAELPEHDEVDGKKIRAISFDLIKRRLDKGLYRRLDMFQEDMFSCFSRARRLSRTDSQVFEDSVEMQAFFIRQRDELCRNGELLRSPALTYTLDQLSADVENLKQEKQLREQPDEENEQRSISGEDTKLQGDIVSTTGLGEPVQVKVEQQQPSGEVSFNQQTFRVGDFVYIESKERGMEPHIACIERLWMNTEGKQMLYGNWFFRPNETYHVSTRKFLEKEVFKSDVHAATPLDEVVGRCCVIFVKDYFKARPEGFPDKDVYVCESRYSTKARAFKKIKIWPFEVPDHLQMIPRDQALEPRRIMSVFRARVEKHKEEIAELEEGEKIPEREQPNVEIFNPQGTEGNVYYQQYSLPCGPIKTGDCVYVRSESNRQMTAQVDTVWVTKEGSGYFRGPWFVPPQEVAHAPTRLFYKQEVFLSSLEDTHPLEAVVKRCCVMDHDEYITSRPTEINEQDVFVCESLYDEPRRLVTPLPREGLKKYSHSRLVYPDETYFFRKPICVQKEPSPLLPKIASDPDIIMDDSLDGPPSSVVSSGEIPVQVIATPAVASKKPQKIPNKKLVTGYILYSSDVRKTVAAKNPDSSFGEISRIVGNEWRNLTTQDKQIWEEKAAKVNEENNAKYIEMYPEAAAASPAPSTTGTTPAAPQIIVNDPVYECGWEQCDWQFEDHADLLEHCVQENVGHVYMFYAGSPEVGEFQCQWRQCGRVRKGAPPFPNILRLVRHIREVHINKGVPKDIPPGDRGRNFVAAKRPGPIPPPCKSGVTIAALMPNNTQASTPSNIGQHVSVAMTGTHATGGNTNTSVSSATVSRPPEPIFVSIPPRPQRLLHSEAYIKYIESLQSDVRCVSQWQKHLRATPENTAPSDPSRLPANWLANGPGSHGTVTNALWALRNFMLKDALGISKST